METVNVTARDLLSNYLSDLNYQFSTGGIEYLNYNSSGTPEFASDAEFETYVGQLEAVIDLMP